MLRFKWHIMIYKANFEQQLIDDFFANIYHQRDNSGLHYKKLSIDGNTNEMMFATLWFESEENLSQITLEQIAKHIYTQLMIGQQFGLPTYARILSEPLTTLGIEMTPYHSGEYDITFWGVPSNSKFTSNS
ncbi:hypothetical protein ACNAN0_06480 [Agrilactobacillus fermenti]|uniref:hypothetical protein n=1 Tax=Agrilactobacillus fermenti TaxID=2586909 RepID=UPI001E2E5370|nr:hypothetical protein [Agrilactobacillus fermenti]MCD2255792.1 hypothetical protein [Agrilactobacillus fermenti]